MLAYFIVDNTELSFIQNKQVFQICIGFEVK